MCNFAHEHEKKINKVKTICDELSYFCYSAYYYYFPAEALPMLNSSRTPRDA